MDFMTALRLIAEIGKKYQITLMLRISNTGTIYFYPDFLIMSERSRHPRKIFYDDKTLIEVVKYLS